MQKHNSRDPPTGMVRESWVAEVRAGAEAEDVVVAMAVALEMAFVFARAKGEQKKAVLERAPGIPARKAVEVPLRVVVVAVRLPPARPRAHY